MKLIDSEKLIQELEEQNCKHCNSYQDITVCEKQCWLFEIIATILMQKEIKAGEQE